MLGVSLAVVIAAAAICMGMDFTGGTQTEVVDNTSTVKSEDGKINVLLMAVDIDGLRTDAMMLASFDTETKNVNILSIPRDTRMYIGNRYQKINAAHAYMTDGKIGGPTAACEAVTRITGIPINYYVDFTFDAVAHVVNELGPVEFTIPDLYGDGVGMVYDDPVQGLHINLPPGTYELDGSQAVQLMRYRHGNYGPNGEPFKSYPNGDQDRVEMQQQFIKALIDQKLNASMILKIPSIFKTISSEIKTNFTVSDIIKYSKYLSGFSTDNISAYELPGAFDTAILDGQRADVWEVDLDATRELVRTVFGYPADNITIENPDGADSASASSSTSNSSSSGGSSGSSNSSKSSGLPEDTSSYDYSSGSASDSSSDSSSDSYSSSDTTYGYDSDTDYDNEYSDTDYIDTDVYDGDDDDM